MTTVSNAVSFQLNFRPMAQLLGSPGLQNTEEISIAPAPCDSLPIAMRATHLTQNDVDVLHKIAEDPNAQEGRPKHRFPKIPLKDHKNGR